ncbi:hypothetical protein V8G54_031220 [Vigna mungo]|uniref:Uncharacterized protein n=1 Tax=Vigna mungo TaxID=3915 RepID=A0AAQ3MWG6_VIGMU
MHLTISSLKPLCKVGSIIFAVLPFVQFFQAKLNRCSTFSPLRNPPFFWPLTISSIITPKLKTSNFIESFPCLAYSGAMYPLHVNKNRLNYLQSLPVLWTNSPFSSPVLVKDTYKKLNSL